MRASLEYLGTNRRSALSTLRKVNMKFPLHTYVCCAVFSLSNHCGEGRWVKNISTLYYALYEWSLTCDSSYLESINPALKEEEKSRVFKSRFWWVNETLGSIRSGSEVGSVKSEKGTDYRVEPEQRQPATTSTFWIYILRGVPKGKFLRPPPSNLEKNFPWLFHLTALGPPTCSGGLVPPPSNLEKTSPDIWLSIS